MKEEVLFYNKIEQIRNNRDQITDLFNIEDIKNRKYFIRKKNFKKNAFF